eukprot:758853-Hanusia_phi.AAC.2
MAESGRDREEDKVGMLSAPDGKYGEVEEMLEMIRKERRTDSRPEITSREGEGAAAGLPDVCSRWHGLRGMGAGTAEFGDTVVLTKEGIGTLALPLIPFLLPLFLLSPSLTALSEVSVAAGLNGPGSVLSNELGRHLDHRVTQ